MASVKSAQGLLFSTAVSSPSTLNAASALEAENLLSTYYTTLGFRAGGWALSTAHHLHPQLAMELSRRAIVGLPGQKVRRYPWPDIIRTLSARFGDSPTSQDQVRLWALDRFDRHVAQIAHRYRAVFAYNGVALHTFKAASAAGGKRIYSVKSLEAGYDQRIDQEERRRHGFLGPVIEQTQENRLALDRIRQEWNLADCVIANSQTCLNSYGDAGLDLSKGHVAVLGFPPPSVTPRADMAPQNAAPLKVLWAGSFSIRKGAHYFLMALAKLDRQRFSIRAFGQQAMPPQALAAYPDLVALLPTLPRKALMEEYRNAEILVLPTLSDGFGMVASEAMSQGLPVITTERAGVAAFILSGENGLIIPAGDDVALAQALEWCLEHREQLAQMGLRARETAASWQWQHYRAQIAQVVSGALA